MTRNQHSPIDDPNMDLSDALRKMHSYGMALDCIGGPKTSPFGVKITSLMFKAYDLQSAYENQIQNPPKKDTLLLKGVEDCRSMFMTGSESWDAMDKLVNGQKTPSTQIEVQTLLEQAKEQINSLAEIKISYVKPYAKNLMTLIDFAMDLNRPENAKSQEMVNLWEAKTVEFCRDQFKESSVSWKLLNEKLECLSEAQLEFAAPAARSLKP